MRLRTAILSLALTMVLAAGACDDEDDKPAVTTTDAGAGGSAGGQGGAGGGGAPGTDAGAPAFVLTEWVHDLVTKHTNQSSDPDTVDDKEGRLLITEDPGAFDPILAMP